MSNTLTEHSTNKELSLNYFLDQLSQGFVFSKFLRRQQLAPGRFYTFLPPDIQAEKITDFGESISFMFNIRIRGKGQEKLSERITYHLQKVRNGIVVFDTPYEVDWPITKKIGAPFFTYDHEVCIFLERNAEGDAISEAISKAGSYPFVCAFSSTDHGIEDRSSADSSDLVEIAKYVKTIVVGAFDGEGFLYWDK